MSNRPALEPTLDSGSFREYYYLKSELADFCRKNGLPASGGKPELTERIAVFLDSGRVLAPSAAGRRAAAPDCITEQTLLGPDFVCSQQCRAFFKAQLGSSFHFTVPFMKWLCANPDKTYGDAVAACRELQAQRKTAKPAIDRQFEYNTYIRDFFADNHGRPLADAIACWNFKKAQKGSHRYEPADLAALAAASKKE